MKTKHRWLIRHGYKITRKGKIWRISDPLDDGQGYHLTGSYAQVINEAFKHLNT